ncbi:carboxymuconolactone decarboxylase family protein [Amycolatopsis sp. NPDC098790]|uniref:carboxymuconolactone decarboxylase family protein n=1 Tax=Amycolatopsis sp. NPDC098790 TaxID=3363939 RepID=UPI00380464D0
MAPGLVRFALRRTLRDVKYVEAVRPRRARGLVRDVYRQVERDFGMLAPPIALHSPAPEVLAAAWLVLRESLVAAGTASRSDKEVVAAAVSAANSCPYCVEVHGMALSSLGDPAAAAAIESGAVRSIPDGGTRALAVWARGEGPLPAGLPSATAAEFTAVAVAFHYLNRVVSVFLGPSPLPEAVPPGARGRVRTVLARLLRPGPAPAPGDALGLLPPSPVAPPPWSVTGLVGDSFARAGAAFDRAGERVVPPRVRELVRCSLENWDGTAPGLSRAWVEEELAGLPRGEHAAGRLALLVAKAPYQVDAAAVTPVLRDLGEGGLVELTAWAAHAAATGLGERLPVRPRGEDAGPPGQR